MGKLNFSFLATGLSFRFDELLLLDELIVRDEREEEGLENQLLRELAYNKEDLLEPGDGLPFAENHEESPGVPDKEESPYDESPPGHDDEDEDHQGSNQEEEESDWLLPLDEESDESSLMRDGILLTGESAKSCASCVM